MAKYLVLPKIGMNMVEGVISEWLVKPGDRVKKDQIVLRAETDKSVQDIFATEDGVVKKLIAAVGDTVPCQGKLALLAEEGEEIAEDEEADEKASAVKSAPVGEKKPASTVGKAAAPVRAGERIRISPLARKMARDFGIPFESLSPAVPGKRIVKADVLREKERLVAAAQAQPAGNEEGRFVPYSHIRKVIARHMRESSCEKPRVSLQCSVDCENLIKFRETLKKRQKVGYNEIIAKACAHAMRLHPDFNCIAEAEGIRIMDRINIGVAVDTENGLLVPVLRDVDKKGLFTLSEEFAELCEKAKNGKCTSDDLSGGTFTVTNLGMFGVESFNPIINSPECFILGLGCMKKVPAVVDDEICIRTQMQIALNFDHAVFDGAGAAKLLRDIKEMLEEPAMMLS